MSGEELFPVDSSTTPSAVPPIPSCIEVDMPPMELLTLSAREESIPHASPDTQEAYKKLVVQIKSCPRSLAQGEGIQADSYESLDAYGLRVGQLASYSPTRTRRIRGMVTGVTSDGLVALLVPGTASKSVEMQEPRIATLEGESFKRHGKHDPRALKLRIATATVSNLLETLTIGENG